MDFLGGSKVQHALWEGGSVEVFPKHVISAMSYVARKGYSEDYEVAERESGRAVYDAKIAEDL